MSANYCSKPFAPQGCIDHYRGIRISRQGRRISIENAVIWCLIDELGVCVGQAALFKNWTFLCGERVDSLSNRVSREACQVITVGAAIALRCLTSLRLSAKAISSARLSWVSRP
ncbi:MAG: MEKHLA domain-containing protein [Methylococcaceae bacterium]|nr:MEKHLA domain-containing protein [Methylococcaceae bacterium]